MDKFILLTGASSGVGREVALELSHKYNLVLNGRNESRLMETKKMCDVNSDIRIWKYDLTSIDNLEEEFKSWLSSEKIYIDSFIHCAGLMYQVPCKMFTVRRFEDVYRVNVISAAILTKILTSKRINDKKLKSIVFISSNISNRGAKSFGMYGSSKAALDGLMRNLAVELAPSIRVNSILPGGMITEMTKEMFEDKALVEHFSATYPLGIGSPRDIVPIIEFLISDSASWITGQQITVDGGRTVDLTEK